ncbi:hypothetical protein MHK_005963, partial [Candidatus Magnetomorum sp. HK-1]
MIRFVYPNVENDEFAGKGVMLACCNSSVDLDEYEVAKPNLCNHTEIITAVKKLRNFPPQPNWNVYSKKGDIEKWSGDSMAFAYLMALVHLSLQLKWKITIDIWFTGSIELKGGDKLYPFLADVYPNEFEVKLKAFLSNKTDSIFFVPEADMSPEMIDLCNENNAKVVSVKKISKINPKKYKKKIIVEVGGDELFFLRDTLFKSPRLLEFPQLITMIKLVSLIILLTTCYYTSIETYNYWLFRKTKNEAIVFELLLF